MLKPLGKNTCHDTIQFALAKKAQIASVLRCLQLESAGYSITVTELVGWEHSMKKELIIPKYTGQPRKNAGDRIEAILSEFDLQDMRRRFAF